MTGRLDRIGAAVAKVLRVLPAVGEPGHGEPGELVAGLALMLRVYLGPIERLTLASAAMMALDAKDAERLAVAALGDLRRGPPLPPFTDLRAEARLWAEWASPAERRAYMAATWHLLPERDRLAFLRAARPAIGRAA